MIGFRVAEERGMRAARLNAVKADIARHLARRELTVAAVAGRQRITPRYVQLLFGQEGTTFSQFVLGQRLTQAHRMLADPLCARWPITAIAFEAGFGDLSYFNRSFRRRYSASPSDVRRAALRGQPLSSSPRVRFSTTPSSLKSKTHSPEFLTESARNKGSRRTKEGNQPC